MCKQFKQSKLWFGCDDGDNGVNGDRMAANDFTDTHNGWKHQQKHLQPCLHYITYFKMCAPLTFTESGLFKCLDMCVIRVGCV